MLPPGCGFLCNADSVLVPSQPCTGACRRLQQQRTLQAYIDEASPGATIIVPPGVYSGPGNRNLTFRGKSIRLTGAPAHRSIIDCEGAGRAFNFAAADGPSVEVIGFRVVNGAATSGGCALIQGGSPTISSCQFVNCSAALGGNAGSGGSLMVLGPAAAPLVRNSSFVGGYASRGGGICVQGGRITIQGCSFEGNVAAPGIGKGGGLMFDNALESVVRDTNITKGRVGFSGGGILAEASRSLTLERVSVRENKSSSHAGGVLIIGSNMTANDCEFNNNTAALFGGGVLGQYAEYKATNTQHNWNTAHLGGGGVKLYSAVGELRNCEVIGNSAPYGAGIEVAQIPQEEDDPLMRTVISVSDSIVTDNVALNRGGGIFVDSADQASFNNVSVYKNIAGAQGGGIFCNANTPVQLVDVRVHNNSAPTGGGAFALTECRMTLHNVTFLHNSASEYGAGMAVTDGANVTVTETTFISNGVPSCSVAYRSPMGGGGLFVGVAAFIPSTQCQAAGAVTPAWVHLEGVTFRGNMATDRGGGVHVTAGNLTMKDVALTENQVVGGVNVDGVGGAVALDERCSAGGCSTIIANLTGVSMAANSAVGAGGALFFNGSSPDGCLLLNASTVTDNRVSTDLMGVGGGLYIGHYNFTATHSTFTGNTAYYGGAFFLAADLRAPGAWLENVNISYNIAEGMGPAIYWLRAKSPNASLVCREVCTLEPLIAGVILLATEALHMRFVEPPSEYVQTNRPFPPVAVELRDFYGRVVRTENGTAEVSGGKAVLTGSEEAMWHGKANFTSLQLKGSINQSYQLNVTYRRLNAIPSTKFLEVDSLDPLPLSVTVAPCAAGSQPNSDLNDCTECSAGTYNLNGGECLPCPQGAVCRGGNDIASQPDFWRASAASIDFHSCKSRGVCQATASSADAACREGHEGPLCDVCWEEYFKFAGSCRACKSAGQAKAMLAVMVTAFTLLCIALFARSWDFGHGPGIMTKIKIFLTHFQMIALFRDYDVLWPGATDAALNWFELANIGFVMLAPECFFGRYNFYMLYVFQMVLPLACVAACVALFYAAELTLVWKDRHGERRVAGAAAGGLIGWLEGLKIRCWKNAFWFVTLLYPRCAMTALQLFSWDRLEAGTFLQADYSVMVKFPDGRFTFTFVRYLIPGILLLFTFAIFIPAFWFVIVWRHRHELDDPVVQARYGFLYDSYSRRFPYWETTEMLRKFLIALIPVFVPTQVDGSLQSAVGQAVLLVYMLVTLHLWPFASKVDNWLQLASMLVLWLLLLTSGVNKWADLSDEGSSGLATIQLTLASGMGFALCCAIFISGLGLARQLLAKLAARRAAKKLGEACSSGGGGGGGGGVGDRGQGSEAAVPRVVSGIREAGSLTGGDGGSVDGGSEGGYHSPANVLRTSKNGSTTSDVYVTASSSLKRGSKAVRATSEAEGEITAARPASFTAAANVAAGGSVPTPPEGHTFSLLTNAAWEAASPKVDSVSAEEEEALRISYRRRVARSSSNLSRRSAAEDLEAQLPTADFVQRSDSSANLLPLRLSGGSSSAVQMSASAWLMGPSTGASPQLPSLRE